MEALAFFRLHAVEFNDMSDELVLPIIDSASMLVSTDDLTSDQAEFAKAMYTAHLCWLQRYQNGGARGPVTFDRDADLSRRYATVKDSDTFLGQSQYGMLYLNIVGTSQGSILTRFSQCL